MKSSQLIGAATVLSLAMVTSTNVFAKERETGRGHTDAPVVYVTSQGLYYDSIVVVDSLPMRGQFQHLVPGEMGLMTEFGPGEPGHRGGRWWIDINEDGLMDGEDKFFLCPLLGPGRTEL